jgi:hypothetical protein
VIDRDRKNSAESDEESDVEDVEGGDKSPGPMEEEVDRAQEREEEASEG